MLPRRYVPRRPAAVQFGTPRASAKDAARSEAPLPREIAGTRAGGDVVRALVPKSPWLLLLGPRHLFWPHHGADLLQALQKRVGRRLQQRRNVRDGPAHPDLGPGHQPASSSAISSSFRAVLRLRAVPRVPRIFSIGTLLNLERPIPSG
jgi:hypothetical protein